MTRIEEATTLREKLKENDTKIVKERNRSEKKELEKRNTTLLKNFINSFSNSQFETWMAKGISQEAIVFSEFFGRYTVVNGLTTTQIRNIFGEMKRIQMKFNMGEKLDSLSLRMLQPKLSYASARGKTGTKQLNQVLTPCLQKIFEEGIESIEIEKRFENFANFFESILAYHKAAGGK